MYAGIHGIQETALVSLGLGDEPKQTSKDQRSGHDDDAFDVTSPQIPAHLLHQLLVLHVFLTEKNKVNTRPFR